MLGYRDAGMLVVCEIEYSEHLILRNNFLPENAHLRTKYLQPLNESTCDDFWQMAAIRSDEVRGLKSHLSYFVSRNPTIPTANLTPGLPGFSGFGAMTSHSLCRNKCQRIS